MDKILSLPLSLAFLFLALSFYALFGSPTPDHPGVIEAIVGGLLLCSILTSGVRNGLNMALGRPIFLKALQVLFLCGLILPTLSGVYYGNDKMLILRDVIAFAFLGLPLFLSEKFLTHEKAGTYLCGLMIFAGIAFALRTLLPVFNIWIPEGELLYLSNSPLALFAAVFLGGAFFMGLQTINLQTMPRLLMIFSGLCVLLAAMLLDVQRATIGAVLISVVLLAIASFITAPKRAIIPVLLIIILCAACYPLLAETLNAIAQKTAAVGMNMRVQEAKAMFDYLALAPETFFVGRGWGASFSSPAVGGLEVNYTHSLLTTMALKGGLIMVVLTVLMVMAALYQIVLIFQRDRVMALALFWPLVIPVLLYASHKSLDFGLLLLMIGVWSVGGGALHPAPASVKNRESL